MHSNNITYVHKRTFTTENLVINSILTMLTGLCNKAIISLLQFHKALKPCGLAVSSFRKLRDLRLQNLRLKTSFIAKFVYSGCKIWFIPLKLSTIVDNLNDWTVGKTLNTFIKLRINCTDLLFLLTNRFLIPNGKITGRPCGSRLTLIPLWGITSSGWPERNFITNLEHSFK